jgi:quinoprotein glucose dehydrogenase
MINLMTGTRVVALGVSALCFAIAAASSARENPQGFEPTRAATDWPSYGGSPDSAQFSALTQITPANVAQLEQVWSMPSGDAAQLANPLVVGGRMFLTVEDHITCVDATTGATLWRAPVNASGARGLVYWQAADRSQRRILATYANTLVALNADDGTVIRSFGTNGTVDLRAGLGRPVASIGRIQSATPGRVLGNLLILGSSPGESYGAPPGDIRAYDVVTGTLAWTFHTIPHPGEEGYDTWPKDAWKTAGAANVWGEMSLDEKRGIIYLPTGSATYDFYGADRVGDNLYSDTLLALDARTGKRLWHFQTVHHDLWDYDNVQAPKLLTIRREGKPVDIVVLAGKTGFLYAFDRVTGIPIWPIVERPVPASDVPGEKASPTQPFPTHPAPFALQSFTEADLSPVLTDAERAETLKIVRAARNEGLFTPPSLRGSVQMPGNHGGAQYGNGAVDPRTGRLYVVGINQPAVLKLERAPTGLRVSILGSGVPGIAAAAETYATHCAMCHGTNGAGQPPVIPRLSGLAVRITPTAFGQVIKAGRGQMPAFPDIPQERLVALYLYLNQLGDAAAAPAAPAPPAAEKALARSLGEPEPGGAVKPDAGNDRYYSAFNFLITDRGLPANKAPISTLSAYDMNSGDRLWQVPYGSMLETEAAGVRNGGAFLPKGSLVATASGLLFSATTDRKLRAWDARTGKVLWERELPFAATAMPAIYAVNGRQYVVVNAGNALMGVGTAAPAGVMLKRAYVAFALPVARK